MYLTHICFQKIFSSCSVIMGILSLLRQLQSLIKLWTKHFVLLIFSPLNRANLKESCKASGVKGLVPTHVGGTRWLPHTLRALNNLSEYSLYKLFVISFFWYFTGQGKRTVCGRKGQSHGFHDKLKDRTTVEFIHFLWDLVIILSRLSLALQKRGSSLAEVANQVSATVSLLEKYSEL